MSAITRPTRLRAGAASICRPKWSGKWPRAATISTTPSASSGNGPAAPIRPTRAIAPSKARLANITASSWSISWFCAAPRSQRRTDTAVSTIATSFIRTTAGNSPAFAFARDAIDDLSQRPKRLSPKYFYDATGSELFEAITRLPEYYPTRTELKILRERGSEIASIIPDNAALVEFGAGATTKVRLLLESCAFSAYVPVDISGDFIKAQAEALRRDFPRLAIYPLTADFTAPFALPSAVRSRPKVGFFPG